MRPKHLLVAAALSVAATAAVAQADDPNLWLEDIQGAKPLATVRQWNAATEGALTKLPGFDAHRQRAAQLLNDPNQIAMPDEVMGDLVANHWVDANHKRGLWRVSPLAAYLAGKPQWRTLIDVDALGKAEGKSWAAMAPIAAAGLPALPGVAEPGGSDVRRRPRIRSWDRPVRRGRLRRPRRQE